MHESASQPLRLLAEPPLERDAAAYLRVKSKRLTEASERSYAGCLAEFARYFPTRQLEEFEPPAGTALLEQYLAERWGRNSTRTYNKNLSVLVGFFRWQVLRGRIHGDPTLPIERARPTMFHRSTFSDEQRIAILAANPVPRDQLALRLLLDFGLRKGALQGVRLQHFDPSRRRLVVFTKGSKVHQVPIPDDGFWRQLEYVRVEPGVLPQHYLLHRQRVVSRRRRPAELTETLQARLAEVLVQARALEHETGSHEARVVVAQLEHSTLTLARSRRAVDTVYQARPELPMGSHGLHHWWYRCLQRAGVVADGVVRGERMHKARHTAGQRVLDKTGNLKAAQKLLGHSSIGTTGNTYADWDLDQLAETMREVIGA